MATGASSLKTPKAPLVAGISKGGKKSPLSVAFQDSELHFDDVPDFADEPAGSFLSLAEAPKLTNTNVAVIEAPGTAARRASSRSRTSKAETAVVEEAAAESVPEAPSTAARRASARSRTSKLEPAVAEEAPVASLPSVSATSNTHDGDESVLDIDDTSTPQELPTVSCSSVPAVSVRHDSTCCCVACSCSPDIFLFCRASIKALLLPQ